MKSVQPFIASAPGQVNTMHVLSSGEIIDSLEAYEKVADRFAWVNRSFIMAQLAPAQNVTVTDADIDARMTDEATTPELRNASMIAVAPTLATGETVFTDAEKAAAKAKADQALADLKAGKDWATVAAAVSTDASKAQGGELGYIDKNAALDGTFVDAMMAVAPNTPTDVVEGADGIYRIGKVTDVIAPSVDATLQEQVKDAGIDLGDFRAAIGRDELRSKLDDAVLAGFLASGPQRKVSEIWMQENASETGEGAVRVRHILYSPNDDPENASKVADSDPGLVQGPARGAGRLRQAQGRPVAVRRDRPQGERRGRPPCDHRRQAPVLLDADAVDPAFAAAIFAPGLVPGQLLAPVKSAFGWHVIQIQHFPTDVEYGERPQDADRGRHAHLRRRSPATTPTRTTPVNGGDIGWVGHGQLDPKLEDAIFATPVGKISDPVKVDGDGVYLFKVIDEETREPDGRQLEDRARGVRVLHLVPRAEERFDDHARPRDLRPDDRS